MQSMAIYPDAIKKVARSLYLKSWTPKEIAAELNLTSARIVYHWAEKYGWSALLKEESLEDCIQRRVMTLTHRDKKTELEMLEIDRLIEHHVKLIAQKNKHAEKMAAAHAAAAPGEGGNIGFMSAGEDSPAQRKGRRQKNDVSLMTKERFDEFAETGLFT